MPVEPVRIAGAEVEVAVPGWSVAGVGMAGFAGRAPADVELRVVPYPALTVFLDFGDGLLVDAGGGAGQRGSAVVGLGAARVRGRAREVELMQVRLSPVVAHAVLGPMAGTPVVALDEVWGRAAERLRERMRDAAGWDERFTIVRAELGRRVAAGNRVDPEVAAAWHRIVLSRGRIRVAALADELGWSRKRLWARFRAQLGVTPKQAAQLVRFDYAAHRLAAGDSVALVSAESGYVDQSHLSRAAATFAGLTPAALASAPWLSVDEVAWAGRPYATVV
ncbi:helix-turn-helix domain-containing protein [Nocardia sp. NPDC051833]|uniref:helix-turn-helix domain-containing protein n=1 Tax=Nocardia sp. NPDC051833 TaxID=3155674 RepID=UPI0034382D2B